MQRLRRLYSGNFLWFRRGARSYLVRGEALLAQAKGFFAPLRSLDPERADLRAVSDTERRDLERRSRELESRMREFEEQRRTVEAIERSLDAKEDALEKKAEAELWRLIDHALATGLARPN